MGVRPALTLTSIAWVKRLPSPPATVTKAGGLSLRIGATPSTDCSQFLASSKFWPQRKGPRERAQRSVIQWSAAKAAQRAVTKGLLWVLACACVHAMPCMWSTATEASAGPCTLPRHPSCVQTPVVGRCNVQSKVWMRARHCGLSASERWSQAKAQPRNTGVEVTTGLSLLTATRRAHATTMISGRRVCACMW